MNKSISQRTSMFIALISTLLLLPCISFAHETRTYDINGVTYKIVAGSLNEPVIVDDKTGVYIELTRDGVPLSGAQENLQVEMIAGDQSRTANLSPIHGAEGQYKSDFIATVPTTLTYRFHGTLEGIPVDLSFTCNPAGHPQSEEDTNRTEVTENVYQTLKRGAFGCPQPKDAFGFPAPASSIYDLQTQIDQTQPVQNEKSESTVLPITALVLSLLALGIGIAAYRRK